MATQTFRLFIATDNADFQEHPGDAVAELLRKIADRIEGLLEVPFDSIQDTNGNTVGGFAITTREPFGWEAEKRKP